MLKSTLFQFSKTLLLRSLPILLALFAVVTSLFGQYPTYASPLDGELRVSGTFGELRSDHYHAGIDFKASTGTPVRSVGDGFIRRIKIAPGGYGQAIYVDHPEGYRSVYGHLSALRKDLIDTVRATQYANETFAVDLQFGPEDFPVRQGEIIGKVGNRGYSFGPHLHFEMRSQLNDAALNPLNFGIKVKDSRLPQLRKLKVYERNTKDKLLRERIYDLLRQSTGHYVLSDTVVVATGNVEFAIKAFDRQDAMPNYNGPYAMQIDRDSSTTYAVRFDSIPFEETRCLNAHVDYAEWVANTSWYHRLASLPGIQHGYFEVKKRNCPARKIGELEEVEIRVKDWSGNVSVLSFWVKYVSAEILRGKIRTTYYQLPWEEKSLVNTAGISLEFPRGALYENLEFQYSQLMDTSYGVVSKVHRLHNALTPLHLPIMLALEADETRIPEGKEDKIVLVHCDDSGEQTSWGGALDTDGKPIALPVTQLGTYCLMIDDKSPVIEPLDRTSKLGRNTRVRFRITDNFATEGTAQGLRYRAELNGEWILMEYDLKKDIIYYDLQKRLPRNGAEMKIWVIDDRGNESVWQGRLRQ